MISELKNLSTYILDYAKKLKIIECMGGKCENCGENRFYMLSFHHPEDNKDVGISHMRSLRFSDLKSEADKCILLCENCHREHHDKEFDKTSKTNLRRAKNKTILLEYKKVEGCQVCGYKTCNKALEFHHIDPSRKDFILSVTCQRSKYKTTNDIEDVVRLELDKTVVLCSNCHKEAHFNKQKFMDNEEKILLKKENMRELSKPYNSEDILKLHKSGMTVTQIAKKYKTSKGTIGGITRKLGLGKSAQELKESKELSLKLYKEKKLTSKEISKITKLSIITINQHLKEKRREDKDRFIADATKDIDFNNIKEWQPIALILFKRGLTAKKISKLLKVNSFYVYQLLFPNNPAYTKRKNYSSEFIN